MIGENDPSLLTIAYNIRSYNHYECGVVRLTELPSIISWLFSGFKVEPLIRQASNCHDLERFSKHVRLSVYKDSVS